VRATAVGPDLARSTVRLERLRRSSEEQPAEVSDDVVESPDDDGVYPDTDEAVDGLPLTA